MKVEIGNHKQFSVKTTETFRNLPVGSVFILYDNNDDYPCVWVKTPFADMRTGDNPVNKNGAFCDAFCINGGEKTFYMQCDPKAVCLVLDMHELFGTADLCREHE